MSLGGYRNRLLKVLQKTLHRNFSLSLGEEHVALQKLCRNFAESELKPIAAKLDKERRFPTEQIKKMGELGLMSVSVPRRWNGSNYDKLALAIAIEEIARGCGGTGAIMSIHNHLYVNLVSKYGTDAQKEVFLKPFTEGALGCFALSEPDAGSDVSAISTEAVLDGDTYVLNGIKSWVTSGLEGKATVVFATVDKKLKHKGLTAFLIPLPSPGLTLGKNEEKLGVRAASTCKFILSNVRIPKSNVIGDVQGGFKLAMMQLDEARVGIAAQALGIAQAALDTAVTYASQRRAFGQKINNFQAVKLKMADMTICLESARMSVWRAAVLSDGTEASTKYSSIAKVAASEAATFVSHCAIQILGGMGYVSDQPAERHYRDARITEIYGGVGDIQRLVIANTLIKEYESKC